MESDRSCCQPFPQPNTSNCTIDCSLGFLACCRGKEEKHQGEGEGQRRREGRPQFGFGRKLTHQLHTLLCRAANKQQAGLTEATLSLLQAPPEEFSLLLTLPSGPVNPFQTLGQSPGFGAAAPPCPHVLNLPVLVAIEGNVLGSPQDSHCGWEGWSPCEKGLLGHYFLFFVNQKLLT